MHITTNNKVRCRARNGRTCQRRAPHARAPVPHVCAGCQQLSRVAVAVRCCCVASPPHPSPLCLPLTTSPQKAALDQEDEPAIVKADIAAGDEAPVPLCLHSLQVPGDGDDDDGDNDDNKEPPTTTAPHGKVCAQS